MDLITIFALFVIVWWMVLFAVLPFGSKPPEQPEPGHADSAPETPHIAKKMAITTVIALIVTTIIMTLKIQGYLSLFI